MRSEPLSLFHYQKVELSLVFLLESNPFPFTTGFPRRALVVMDQWRKKAALHQTNTIFVELGDDFTYATKSELETVYNTYKVKYVYLLVNEVNISI